MLFQPPPKKGCCAIKTCSVFLSILAWALVTFANIPHGSAAAVAQDRARLVAENLLAHHLSLYHDWNGTQSPRVGNGTAVQYQGRPVAYNFAVIPSGHVLVALDDTLSPVQLYSTRSTFNPDRAGQPQAIEAWIVPEQHGKISGVGRRRAAGLQIASLPSEERIAQAWDLFTQPLQRSADPGVSISAAAQTQPLVRSAAGTVGPLLTTSWGQDTPFNLLMPADYGCTHALAGCVATAWAQVLNYWEWPEQGTGSHSYTWNSQTISVDFSASSYDWGHMADAPDGTVPEENAAISKLIYDVAVAAETDFGCLDSSSEKWAHEILDLYFKYKAMTYHDRLDYDANQWFALFKNELDASPPRPVLFSIFSTAGGHEVVVDGYQTDPTDMVHINFGWPDITPSYDGFKDISGDFEAFYTWTTERQYAVTGIEPNRSESFPTVNAGADQTVNEGALVTLTGTASHVGYTIVTYEWIPVEQPYLQITNSDQATASFTAPSVLVDTNITFRLKAVDEAGNVGYDECVVTVRNVDTSISAPVSGDSGGGGGGGCFIRSLR